MSAHSWQPPGQSSFAHICVIVVFSTLKPSYKNDFMLFMNRRDAHPGTKKKMSDTMLGFFPLCFSWYSLTNGRSSQP